MSWYQRLRIWNRARRYLRKNERDECTFTIDCLRPGMSVLDIGAHKGAFTYWMSNCVGQDGHVYAFEPQPTLAHYLEDYAATSRYRNITVCPVALSDRQGSGTLHISATQWATLSVAPDPAVPSVEVPLATLDHYLEKIAAARPIAFIKCDVELHELQVLRGAGSVLQTDRPILLFESTPVCQTRETPNATFEYLHSIGYLGYFFYDRELVPLVDYTPEDYPLERALVENFVFVHRDSASLASCRPPYAVQWQRASCAA